QRTRAALRVRICPKRIRGNTGASGTRPGRGGPADHQQRGRRGSRGRARRTARRRASQGAHRALTCSGPYTPRKYGASMTDINRTTVRIPTPSGFDIEALLYLPEGQGPFPAVVMGHGLGAV